MSRKPTVRTDRTAMIRCLRDLVKKQQQQIAKLAKQLAELKEKAIVPRFKVNDRLFVIVNNEIEEYYVDEVLLRNKGTLVAYRDICKKTEITEKNEIFATEQEAQAKLKEIQGNE